MDVVVYSARAYDRQFLNLANAEGRYRLKFLEARLDRHTAGAAAGAFAVCAFVNDTLDAEVLALLQQVGIKLVVLRCAGFNNVDLDAAAKLGIAIGRVPEYSPYAVAEHTVALLLMLNRRLHRAYNRVREGNFALDGLLGFDLHGKTVGVIGTGKIGRCFARIMIGFGCTVLGADPYQDPEALSIGVRYVPLDALLRDSDVVSLHCPLLPATHHLINKETLQLMKPGAVLLNTSRGGVVDTAAVISALKQGRLGGLGIDVYEEESDLFFRDMSDDAIQDDVFARLLTFSNVVVTGHQAFFTQEALTTIAETTIDNIDTFLKEGQPRYVVSR
jgi:D-lactate dehydrogenase